MVFMNARNSLANFAPINLQQLLSVPASPGVKIIVEWGSLNWRNHVYRFPLTPGMKLPDGTSAPGTNVEDIGDTDMGAAQTLENFVTWAQASFPAKRYMLVLWDHGAGYRLEYVKVESLMMSHGLFSRTMMVTA